MTSNRVLIPPPLSPAGRMAVYPTTYFPAAATAGAATPIALDAGEERTDVTISMRPVPAVRVSGRLVTPDGSAPPPTTIRLVGAAMTDVITRGLVSGPDHVGLDTVTGMSDATGRFTLLGVPAGDYVLTHANTFLSRAIQQGQPAYWISQRVTVGAEDLSDLVVTLRPALRVEGRIEFRGGAARRRRSSGSCFETPFGEPGQFSVAGYERRNAFVFHRRRRRPVHRPALRDWRLVRALRHAGRQGHHGPRVRPAGGRDVAGRDLHGSAVEGVRHRDRRAGCA